MSFSTADIAGMLGQYEAERRTGMDVAGIAGIIYDYTSGYPFLVSYICKLIDERVDTGEIDIGNNAGRNERWTKEGVLAAVRFLLSEQNTLFESLFNKLEDYPELEIMLRDLLLCGKDIPYVLWKLH